MSRPVTAVLLSAALLSACGTGLEAQTYKPRTPHDSTSATLGKIALRGLAVDPPAEGESLTAGGHAVVTGVLVNTGTEDDALVDASSDAAATVALETADQQGTVPIPAAGTSGTAWSLVLDGLKADLQPGRYVTLTLVFAKAGRTTVQVPIRTTDNGLSKREVAQDPYHEG